MLGDGIYYQVKLLHVSAYSGHLQVNTILLRVSYICIHCLAMLRSHHRATGEFIWWDVLWVNEWSGEVCASLVAYVLVG